MKKIFLIFIFFIFLFSFNKSNNDFNFDKFIKNLIETIKQESKETNITLLIEQIWNNISYVDKNKIYQKIDIIKTNCPSILQPKRCKMIFDILGIL